MNTITLTIDGTKVTTRGGRTVLEAAREAGISIPTICEHPKLPNYGGCRMCVVEIDGIRGYPTSCTTPATEGMVVRTQTVALNQLRSRTLELMLAGHPNACLVCDDREECEKLRTRPVKATRATRCMTCSNRSHCDVRVMAADRNIQDMNLPTQYAKYKVDHDDPFIDRDHNLCILCGRCWRICEQLHGKPAISVVDRGRWARVSTAFETSYVNSGCTFCGACIDICPTGTLTDRYARWYGKAEDDQTLSTCSICPEGCELKLGTDNRRLIFSQMVELDKAFRLCAIGRFAWPQLVNSTDRLRKVMVRDHGELIGAGWADGITVVAEQLQQYRGGEFICIYNGSDSRETRFMYQRFAEEVMGGRSICVPAGEMMPDDAIAAIASGRYKAAMVAGDYLDEKMFDQLDYVVLLDSFRSASAEMADAVMPVAILSEVDGTFQGRSGEVNRINPATDPPGDARSESAILADLFEAMDAGNAGFAGIPEITALVGDHDQPQSSVDGSPRDHISHLPQRFRGHLLADHVPALKQLGLETGRQVKKPVTVDGFSVIAKLEVVPNFHMITIHAPAIAKYAKPGQFVIVMVDETSERTPFTLVDWHASEGTIDIVIEEVGRSSRELAQLQTGDAVAHVSGPLGLPLPVKQYGTVVMGGGCYGIGAIYPLAKALKQAGNRVIIVMEASSSFMLYMVEKLDAVCDKLIVATKDGSSGIKGGVPGLFVDLHEAETSIDQYIAIGCTFMMRKASEMTKPLGVPLLVALNPIMVDGTGMCGACRVSVGDETQFACVDGPFFNGHEVDWDELFYRRAAYARTEIQAIPQDAGVHHVCEHEKIGHAKLRVSATAMGTQV